MLSQQENEFLTTTNPGTPMGELFRRYWQPFLLKRELPENDGAPVRVRLLGEDLIAFRDSDGRVGLIGERCPHRGASLYFGINQESGIMCIYHGWKYNVDGNCIDMPSDVPGSRFMEKVHATAYPTIESAGVIWAYMGPVDKQPPPPTYYMNMLPEENVVAMRTPIYCNYLQSIEGNLDSTHLGTLHMYYENLIPADQEYDKPGHPSPALRPVSSQERRSTPELTFRTRTMAIGSSPFGRRPRATSTFASTASHCRSCRGSPHRGAWAASSRNFPLTTTTACASAGGAAPTGPSPSRSGPAWNPKA